MVQLFPMGGKGLRGEEAHLGGGAGEIAFHAGDGAGDGFPGRVGLCQHEAQPPVGFFRGKGIGLPPAGLGQGLRVGQGIDPCVQHPGKLAHGLRMALGDPGAPEGTFPAPGKKRPAQQPEQGKQPRIPPGAEKGRAVSGPCGGVYPGEMGAHAGMNVIGVHQMKAPGDFRGEKGRVRDAAHAEQDDVQPACPGGQLPGGEHGEGGTDLRRGPAGEDGGWGHIRLGLHGAGRGLTQISIAIDSDLKQNGQPPLEQNWGIYKPIRREGELERKRTKEARLLRPNEISADQRTSVTV